MFIRVFSTLFIHVTLCQVKDIESKLRQRSFLHSKSVQNGCEPEQKLYNSPSNGHNSYNSYSLSRTKSSGSVNGSDIKKTSPNPLLKSKSSTYISPEQSESLMYNTKVTLTLRRSNSHLSSPSRSTEALANGNKFESSNYQNGNNRNGLHKPNSQNYYYFGSNPHSSSHDKVSSLPKPPLPPPISKPVIPPKTVNIFILTHSPLLVNILMYELMIC